MRIVGPALGLAALVAAASCQSYDLEAVDPQTVIAVETSGTFVSARAPILMVVQDRSRSMLSCFGAPAGAPTPNACDADGDGKLDTDARLSRMEVSRRVMSAVAAAHASDVWFGLIAFGVPMSGRSCGPGQLLVTPAESNGNEIVQAYEQQTLLITPDGGTPTTEALNEAFTGLMATGGSALAHPERPNYVVLVTDGLMNCDDNFPKTATCICSSEQGCQNVGGPDSAYGQPVPNPDTVERCLDLTATLQSVARLRAAGIKVFVVGLGEELTANVAITALNQLADAGGVPRNDPTTHFYPAGDEATLQSSLDEIIKSITAPCSYKLDGEVCDGRLVSIALSVRDTPDSAPRTVQTHCDPNGGEHSWFFKEGDPRTITFDPSVCHEFEGVSEVKITIRGVQNDCPTSVPPSCGAPPP